MLATRHCLSRLIVIQGLLASQIAASSGFTEIVALLTSNTHLSSQSAPQHPRPSRFREPDLHGHHHTSRTHAHAVPAFSQAFSRPHASTLFMDAYLYEHDDMCYVPYHTSTAPYGQPLPQQQPSMPPREDFLWHGYNGSGTGRKTHSRYDTLNLED